MIKTLLKELKQYKKYAFLTIGSVVLEVVLEVCIPFLMGKLIDNGIELEYFNGVVYYGAIMFVVSLVTLVLGYLAGSFAAKASSGFAANIREKMFRHIQTYAFSNIDKFSTAGLVTRLTTDVTNIQQAFQMSIRMAIRAPMMLIGSFFMAYQISNDLSMIFVVAVLFLAIVLFMIIRKASRYFDRAFPMYDRLNESVQENVVGIRVVKSFVREHHENDKFKKASHNIYDIFMKAEKVLCFNNPAMMVCVYGSILLLSWLGAKDIVAGNLTTGSLSSLLSYVMQIMMSLMMLSMVFVMLTMSLASGKRIAEVLNEQSDLVSPPQAQTNVKDGSIDFENVTFSYKHGNGVPILNQVNLHIDSGETIGIIGGTGSAKSTLVNLISRLYDVDEGVVKVGGVDVRHFDLTSLRNQVAVVLQQNVLFSGTIYENLRWGDANATDKECQEACELACADEFINRMPKGYDTYIEQGGRNVSGGQKQRLCIARALLKKPKILILDDSTSAVDTATDHHIQEAFEHQIPNTTKIIISQRITSVQHANRIMVLDDGVITGFDTHENLLKNNEIYQTIFETQAKGKEE